MKHGSLFSGIGGFDLAAQWMDWENVFHCEINPIGQRVLKYYWPESISYNDIKKTDFTPHKGAIDILSGGFPCQPFSQAGKRKGTEDDRHLWPEMLRAIREIQPRWIVGENVRGLLNWSKGLVFDQVQTDLETAGYEVLPFLLPACAVNAPHRRDRIWFVAKNTNDDGRAGDIWEKESGVGKFRDISTGINEWVSVVPNAQSTKRKLTGDSRTGRTGPANGSKLVAQPRNDNVFASDTKRIRQPRQRWPEGQSGAAAFRDWKASWADPNGRWPTEPTIRSGNDGIPTGLDGITIPKHRKESLMAYGNAVVPQVVVQIFKAISEYGLTCENCK